MLLHPYHFLDFPQVFSYYSKKDLINNRKNKKDLKQAEKYCIIYSESGRMIPSALS